MNADLLRARRNAGGLQSLLGENLKTVSLERAEGKIALGERRWAFAAAPAKCYCHFWGEMRVCVP